MYLLILFLFEILAAARNENAVKIPVTEKIYESVVGSALYSVKNQKETTLCITNPSAKESMAKSVDSLVIIPLEEKDRVLVKGFDICIIMLF